MQIVIAGVIYELSAEAVFLFIVGAMTLAALIQAGLAWIVGSEGGGSPNCNDIGQGTPGDGCEMN